MRRGTHCRCGRGFPSARPPSSCISIEIGQSCSFGMVRGSLWSDTSRRYSVRIRRRAAVPSAHKAVFEFEVIVERAALKIQMPELIIEISVLIITDPDHTHPHPKGIAGSYRLFRSDGSSMELQSSMSLPLKRERHFLFLCFCVECDAGDEQQAENNTDHRVEYFFLSFNAFHRRFMLIDQQLPVFVGHLFGKADGFGNRFYGSSSHRSSYPGISIASSTAFHIAKGNSQPFCKSRRRGLPRYIVFGFIRKVVVHNIPLHSEYRSPRHLHRW